MAERRNPGIPEPATRPVSRRHARAAMSGVVIVAAGTGSRTGGTELKQFRWVAGKPMLLHSVQAFQRRADVALVVCVLPRSHAGDPPPWLFQCDVDRLLVSVGGANAATRCGADSRTCLTRRRSWWSTTPRGRS